MGDQSGSMNRHVQWDAKAKDHHKGVNKPSKKLPTSSELVAKEWHRKHTINWVAPSAVRLLRKQARGVGVGGMWPEPDIMWGDPVMSPGYTPGGGQRVSHAVDQPSVVSVGEGKFTYSVKQFYELGCEIWRPIPKGQQAAGPVA
eukprot:CAMPEP_0173462402 /NCGR_PEP_ID=MMETSP1357-20121228/66587_1 /TAXON_ID=77926 /ORGANISM="Hemiselmis rufescens, Strain PCC563" /LENGTH=143 /DNA_ID=CAMNT_0014430129 /DNA_START=46 /DNA_END=473 /DNA_ORIENTATION=-